MSDGFERVAVVGLGLLGGSVAAAVRRAGIARRVAGATRSREARSFALARGLVDEVEVPARAVRGADLVVLATPVSAMADALRGMAPGLSRGAIVTDVGSVKADPAETLPGLLPEGVRYVGSHPMAGSHERGIEHARPDLFEDAACVVDGSGEPEAVARVQGFWSALGCRVVLRDPARHDAEVAWTSHVPHALAFAFAAALRAAPPGAREVSGTGFRDFTRIAHSDPELWGDILTANRKAVAAPLAAVGEALDRLARAIEANDADTVERIVAEARSALAAMSPPSTTREGHGTSNENPNPRSSSPPVTGTREIREDV